MMKNCNQSFCYFTSLFHSETKEKINWVLLFESLEFYSRVKFI